MLRVELTEDLIIFLDYLISASIIVGIFGVVRIIGISEIIKISGIIKNVKGFLFKNLGYKENLA